MKKSGRVRTSEWTSVRWVDELDHADVGLTGHGSCAGGSSWDGDLEWVVLVDVGGTLHDTDALESTGPSTLLGLLDVTLGTWYLGHDLHGLPWSVTGTGSVDHGLVWTSSVGGNNVHGTRDGSSVSYLWEG